VVYCGGPQGREPRHVRSQAQDRIVLLPASATMDDCHRLAELLFGAPTPTNFPLTIGFMEIESPVELCVTAVYTASALEGGPVSIDVEQIEGKKKRRRSREPGVSSGSDPSEVSSSTELPF